MFRHRIVLKFVILIAIFSAAVCYTFSTNYVEGSDNAHRTIGDAPVGIAAGINLNANQIPQGPISKTAEAFAVTPELKSMPEAMNGIAPLEVSKEAETNLTNFGRMLSKPWAKDLEFEDLLAPLSRVLSQSRASQAMPTPSFTIEGISGSDVYNIYNNTGAPPDIVGDAGLNHYFQSVYFDVFRIYDKTTGAPVTGVTKLAALFSAFPASNPCRADTINPFAPPWKVMVNYDPLADRWIISRIQGPQAQNECIAVSQTGDPTGSWYIYHFKTPVNKVVLFTQMGVWTDGYYLSNLECAGNTCDTIGLYAFNREKLISGDPSANFVYFSQPLITGSIPVPSDIDGYVPPPAGTPQIFFEMDADEYGAGRTDSLLSYEFVPNYANPASSTLTAKPAVAVAAFDARDPAPGPSNQTGRADIEQPTESYRNLNSLANSLMYRVAYRNLGSANNPVNSYVMNWTVNVSGVAPTTAAEYQAAPRWTELRRSPAGALSVFDQGTHAPDPDPAPPDTRGNAGLNRWNGSIAQDNQGNLALGFSRSGPKAGQFPSIFLAGRTGGQTPAGVMNEGEALMFAGTGFQGGFGSHTTSHWGNYSLMTVDPSDNCTFWYTNEYRILENQGDTNLNPFRWNTRIGKFKFPSCTPQPKGQIAANVTFCGTGAPVNNAREAAKAGNFIRTTGANGNLISNIVAAPGTYAVSAGKDNILPALATSTNVIVTNGGTTSVNLCLNGADVDATTAVIRSESCAGNNAADPGETMTVDLSLKFIEGNPTTNLTATLLPGGGVTNPGAAQNYGTLSLDGTPKTRPFTFTVNQNVVPDSTITLTLALTDGAANLGTVTYALPVGRDDSPGQIFDYAGDPVTVSANEERTTTVNVSGVSGTIQDLDFIITEKLGSPSNLPGIYHSRIGDLDINLTSPQGTTVRLIYWIKGLSGNLAGCESDSFVNTTLDDSALILVDDACPGASETSGPLTGKFRPNSPLSAFNGQNPNGTWTLSVKDYFFPHYGVIYSYRLNFRSFQPAACTSGKTIAGTVKYGVNPAKSVSNVAIGATGSSTLSVNTNSTGHYSLSNLSNGGNYTVTLTKTTDKNGITAFDATLVLRCVAAGANCALTHNQRIAANTDADTGVTAFDATQILRYVAANGSNANTGQVGNWKFEVPSRNYSPLNASFPNEDYMAFLIGEVDGDWTL
ncbi:MAG: proprotein convertase P-domain-containing protein [Acidobacteriota bacterium]|nr:proprotein convertase P-domain-containing protein [Acidobacteriota bacterium]